MEKLKIRILGFFLGVSFLLMFLDSGRVLESAKAVVQTVTMPGQFLVYRARIGAEDAFSFLRFWKSGEARIKNLEQRNLELLGYKVKTESLERENRELREQLGAQTLSGRKMLPAMVLGTGRFMEIGVGTGQGAAEGQTVVYLDNLVGKIVKVSGRVSFVQLPTDSEAKVPAKAGEVQGLVLGQFNSAMILSQVAQNEELEEGDVVLTSGEGGTYAADLIIGKISVIREGKTGLFKEAVVVPFIDYSRLTTVFVVLE